MMSSNKMKQECIDEMPNLRSYKETSKTNACPRSDADEKHDEHDFSLGRWNVMVDERQGLICYLV